MLAILYLLYYEVFLSDCLYHNVVIITSNSNDIINKTFPTVAIDLVAKRIEILPATLVYSVVSIIPVDAVSACT